MKHEFKVGDRVRIRQWEDMAREFGVIRGSIDALPVLFFGSSMKHLCGRTATISKINDGGHGVVLKDWSSADGDMDWAYCTKMLEHANENGGKEMKQFTKTDLRNGDFVVTRDGDVGVVIDDIGVIVYQGGKCSIVKNLGSNLSYSSEPGIASVADIMKVYRPTKIEHHCFCCYEYAALVYDRDTPTKMTLAEIEEKLGHKVEIVGDK